MHAQEQYLTIDELENAVDSLEMAAFCLQNLRWKWSALAIHHALYSMCIVSLVKWTADSVVKNSYGKDDEGNLCQINGPIMESRRLIIRDGGAYRINWIPTAKTIPVVNISVSKTISDLTHSNKRKLIGFWTAIARVQDSHFWMARDTRSTAVHITDDDLLHLEYLHNYVRNELMHFIPKSYSICIEDMHSSLLVAVNIIEYLVVHAQTINWPIHGFHYERVVSAVKTIRETKPLARE